MKMLRTGIGKTVGGGVGMAIPGSSGWPEWLGQARGRETGLFRGRETGKPGCIEPCRPWYGLWH